MNSPTEYRLVQVCWNGPLHLKDVLARTETTERGLYQIYGQHAVFGPGSLLYIGMAKDQSFGDRFRQHYERWLRFESDVEVRLGFVHQDAVAHLEDVEALTVWWHSPPYNSKNIWRYRGQPLRVQNWESRGPLHPEYSSHWSSRMPPEGDGDT